MTGTIDISQLNTPPEQAEFETAKFFADLGKDIVFIRPSAIPNQLSPDIIMDGVEWEIKCPRGNSKRTIENNMRKAIKQSHNIIFDLRHLKIPEKQSVSELEKDYRMYSQIKKLMIIKKNGELMVFQ